MGLEKAIEHGKEKRKPFKGAKAVDCSCRNHGTCEWCLQNRTYKNIKAKLKSQEELEEVDEYIFRKHNRRSVGGDGL